MLSRYKFQVKMNVIFSLLFHAERNKQTNFMPCSPLGFSLFKNSNVTSARYSCKSSWPIFERNRFPIMRFRLSMSEPRSAQERL